MSDEKNRGGDKQKNFWEPVRAISTLLVAVAGLTATFIYNEKQTKLNEIQAVRQFFPDLLSEDQKKQKLAIYALKELTNKELAARFIEVAIDSQDQRIEVLSGFGSQAVLDFINHNDENRGVAETARKAYDKISAQELTAGDREMIKELISRPAKNDSSTETKSGWVYLGSYLQDDAFWETRYFDFESAESPDLLKGGKIKVRVKTGAINVRQSMPDKNAKFGAVIDVLQPGMAVQVEKVSPGFAANFIWAKIIY